MHADHSPALEARLSLLEANVQELVEARLSLLETKVRSAPKVPPALLAALSTDSSPRVQDLVDRVDLLWRVCIEGDETA